MKVKRFLAIWIIRLITAFMVRTNDKPLKRVPDKGPLIMVVNHINILDAPILLAHLYPRPITAIVKIEAWKNPFFRIILTLWNAVPVRRGESDLAAMRRCIKLLKDGYILGVSPEGTRSGHGELLPAHAGMITMALQSGASLIPIGYFGHEQVWSKLRKLQRSDFNFVVGRPFKLDPHGEKVTHPVREQMLDEVMYQLAALLPPDNRGAYNNVETSTAKYISFLT